jgi:hypothetical protein
LDGLAHRRFGLPNDPLGESFQSDLTPFLFCWLRRLSEPMNYSSISKPHMPIP